VLDFGLYAAPFLFRWWLRRHPQKKRPQDFRAALLYKKEPMMNLSRASLLVLWATAIALAAFDRSALWLLLPLAATAANELAYASTGVSPLFPAADITENFYDISAIPTRWGHVDHNYSEGYYPDGDLTVSPARAEAAKFDEILRLLDARPGDVVLDLGSGTCTFEVHCKRRGITAIGLTLSAQQVAMCESKGVLAFQGDFSEFHPQFEGAIDHAVILGSSEHLAGGPHCFRRSFEKKADELARVLSHVRRYFRPIGEGRKNAVFYSGLHINPRFACSVPAFVLDRTYGGTLQLDAPGFDVVASAKKAGFEGAPAFERDSTREYFLATKLNPRHFGDPVSPFAPSAIALMAIGAVYPMAWYMWAYYVFGMWMWMFDGRLHLGGSDRDIDLTFQPVRERRPCTLRWAVFTEDKR
jgi:SAM-dependent methyltransferase